MSASGLELSVFGGLQIRFGKLSLGEVLPQKAQALLCYVAVERHEHARPALASLLWSEFAEFDAATNLRQALTQLRRVLDPYLLVTRHTVTFNADAPYRLDCDEFARCLTRRSADIDVDQWRAAIDLYRGDFLQGFTLRDAPAFDDWAILQRERFHTRAEEVLLALSDHTYVRGEFALAITYATRLLELDPWREEAHRRLMWLHVRTGQRSAALAQYQSCRRILDRELGVEPMAETTALYERIKAAQAAPAIFVPSSPFVGRPTEQREIARRLADPATRLLTIVGPGGIGKTRLALEVAAAWSPRFLHGARFVDLTAVTGEAAFVSTLVSALGGIRGSSTPRLQLREALAGKDLLLVLDNFEQLVDQAADVLVDILGQAPDVRLLVTSRERLQLRDEWLIELTGLDLPPSTAAGSETYSAIALFVASARKACPDFVLCEEDMAAVARICRLVDGTPLGIELSAAWTRVLSCGEIAREIEQSLEFLTTPLRDLPVRHRSLRAVFDHSWRLLGPEERRVLRRLAVFRGGCSREAAEEIAGASAALLRALLDKSLVYLRPGTAPTPRYDMHEMVRHYAWQQLDQAGELDMVRALHHSFFLRLAERAQPQLGGVDQKSWLDLLDREHDNLREAVQTAVDRGEEEHGLRLAGALWRFWWTRGYLVEGASLLRSVLSVPGQSSPAAGSPPGRTRALRAQALHGLGVLLQEQGDYMGAEACHEQSLALRRALGDRRGVAFSLNSLGVLAMDQGEYARAEALYEESLALKRELGDTAGISGTLNNLGIAVSAQGHAERAESLYQESLDLCRALDDQDGIAVALVNLGLVALDRHDTTTAEPLLTQSLALFLEVGDQDGAVECIEGLAGVAGLRGEIDRAARLFAAAAAVRTAIHTPWTRAEQQRYEPVIAETRRLLGEAAWAAAWAEGQALTPEQVIAR